MNRFLYRFLYALFLIIGSAVSVNATVLFPFFVDIAPKYEKGSSEEFQAAGITNAMYHSTQPDFLVSTLTAVESFLKDTLPSDVTRTEQKIGDRILVTYTSINRKDDTIDTKPLKTTIYVLSRPDKSYVAAYAENEVDN